MNFLHGITILLGYQLLGSVLVLIIGSGIPGPVLGMFLLFLTLLILRSVPASLDTTANQLLTHLSLLFIPAGVGVVTHLQRIGSEWLPIVSTLFISTLVSMTLTAWVMQWMMKWMQKKAPHA